MRALAVLPKYDAACRAVAAARRVDEVKALRDLAEMRKTYARIANDKQMEVDAKAIQEIATRRLGQIMDEQARTVGKAKGGEHGGKRRKIDGLRENPSNAVPSLTEAGIDKNLAHAARKAAALTEKQFEAKIEEIRNPPPPEPRRPRRKRVTIEPSPDGEDGVGLEFGDQENVIGSFLTRASLCRRCAVFSGVPTRELIAEARKVVERWQRLVEAMEEHLEKAA